MLNVTHETLMIIICSLIILILLLMLPPSLNQSEKKKKRILNHILVKEEKNSFLKSFSEKVEMFLIKTNIDNVPEKDLLKNFEHDYMISLIGSLLAIVFSKFVLGNWWMGSVIAIIMMVYPVYGRIDDAKQYKAKYLEGFYHLINYIILLMAGGLNISAALEKTEELLPDSYVIKRNLKRVLKERKISGISGQTLTQCLKGLNEGLDIMEINNFIDSIELSTQKGTPISESLRSQLSFIDSQQFLAAKDKIAGTDSTITIVKTVFGIALTLILFIGPPIISAIIQFSTGI